GGCPFGSVWPFGWAADRIVGDWRIGRKSAPAATGASRNIFARWPDAALAERPQLSPHWPSPWSCRFVLMSSVILRRLFLVRGFRRSGFASIRICARRAPHWAPGGEGP